jgi:TPR repeat protein
MADETQPATGAKACVARGEAERRRVPRVGLIALLVLAATGAGQGVDAAGTVRLAQRAEPRISVSAAIVAQPASQAPLSIQIGPPEALPANSFVRVRGLPPSISLTEGHAIGPGSWAIPLFGLSALKANIPAGVSGRSEIVISLVAVDGALLAEATAALVVGPAAMLAPPDQKRANAVSPPSPVPAIRPERSAQPAPRPPELSAEEKSRAEKLVAHGERFLSQGNIAVARQYFQRAAEAGFAQGAIRLAATYDPAELARLQAQGVVPDRAEARKWYERARELGAPEAEERLARLGGS